MKTIHSLTILDKSGSMKSFLKRTIEGINSSIFALKNEVDPNTRILNTLLQFSSSNNVWNNTHSPTDFVFTRIGTEVQTIADITEKDYVPDGGTPLLDAIGIGIEKIKEFHKNDLGSDDLHIIVTIFTDGQENSSTKYNRDQIKKMIDHFQSDGKWVFTFIGCGSFENVSAESAKLGVLSSNNVAFNYSDEGTQTAYMSMAASYTNFTRCIKKNLDTTNLFTETK
jgi:hypothetical protein